ncbi:MAG: UvrD-helicase domain-containing protein [Anaerolineales bacterium]
MELLAEQQRIVQFARHGGGGLAVVGPPGTGKSTALVARLVSLVREGRRPYELLVLVPQRAPVARYEAALAVADAPTRGGAEIATYYGLCRRLVGLFWPLLAPEAGMDPAREPTFLTIETTQYYLWQIVEPLIRSEGYFADVPIRRDRLLSQLIDNLNKSALVGFDHTEIFARLRGAWVGEPDRVQSFWQAQDCATRFRAFCRERGLLDLSLTTELFDRYLLPQPAFQRYLAERYRHLIVDNLEENVPVAQRLVAWLIAHCDSAVVALDEGGGHRLFLGADAAGAQEVADGCREHLHLTRRVAGSPSAVAFAEAVGRALRAPVPVEPEPLPAADPRDAVYLLPDAKYWVGMVRAAAAHIAELVAAGTPAHRIAVVAPYVSEVLRFTLQEELAARGIALFLLRPSTPLRDQDALRGLLVLATLAHPRWVLHLQGEEWLPSTAEVALALETALGDLDPVRARQLAMSAWPVGARTLADLASTPSAAGSLWADVGYQVRERYQTLQQWLAVYAQGEPLPLDVFVARLFGDVLSRAGFGLHSDPDRIRACGRLVESARNFFAAVGRGEALPPDELSRAYVELVLGGMASAEYLLDWPTALPENAVVLATAWAYVTRDLRSDVQVWLDVGAEGWWDRPNQPLTHPYVLSRRWPVGRPWREIEEDEARRASLSKLVYGLAARCEQRIALGTSELGVDGLQQAGPLERAVLRASVAGGRRG